MVEVYAASFYLSLLFLQFSCRLPPNICYCAQTMSNSTCNRLTDTSDVRTSLDIPAPTLCFPFGEGKLLKQQVSVAGMVTPPPYLLVHAL